MANKTEHGFTLIEVSTVVGIIGLVAVLAFPSMKRMNREQATKSSATQMAGALETARSRAVAEGTPHLVFVNDPGTGDGESGGGCAPVAVIVRDTDRSYTLTDGDRQQEITLDAANCRDVKLYGQDDTARPYADLELPAEDFATRGAPPAPPEPGEGLVGGLIGGLTEGLGLGGDDDSSGPGPGGKAPPAPKKPKAPKGKVEDSVVNGSTFPIDTASGRPVVAFSERGIPVDPENPTSWGSGAGAIYLTDGAEAVYAAVVQPMGEIKLRKYESASNEWK